MKMSEPIEIGDPVKIDGDDGKYIVDAIDNRMVYLRCLKTGCSFWAKRSEISPCQKALW